MPAGKRTGALTFRSLGHLCEAGAIRASAEPYWSSTRCQAAELRRDGKQEIPPWREAIETRAWMFSASPGHGLRQFAPAPDRSGVGPVFRGVKVYNRIQMDTFKSEPVKPFHRRRRSPRWAGLSRAYLAGWIRANGATCSKCGKIRRLETHHIVPIHVDPTRELDPSNLAALCRDCHYLALPRPAFRRAWATG